MELELRLAELLATRLAGAMDLNREQASDVYYMTLLRFVGCTAPSHGELSVERFDWVLDDFPCPRALSQK